MIAGECCSHFEPVQPHPELSWQFTVMLLQRLFPPYQTLKPIGFVPF